MANYDRMSCNLEQEIKNILLTFKTTNLSSLTATPSVRSQIVKGVCGVVKLASGPHQSLTLDTGTVDEPYIVPLTVANMACHLCQWISAVGKHVFIQQLLVVCEQFQASDEHEQIHYLSVLVSWENIRILEDTRKPEISIESRKPSASLSSKNTGIITEPTKEDVALSSTACRVMVHHVTMPFFVDDPEKVICLVFISHFNRKQLEVKRWLVLREEQVAWREFLVPHREYLIHFPPEIGKHFFDKSHRPLDELFEQHSRELAAIFHHKIVFYALRGVLLPFKSKIFLTNNSVFSEGVNKFTHGPLCSWFSADEADYADDYLVTFYGQVDSVMYSEDCAQKLCPLCIRSKPKEPLIKEPGSTLDHPWTNPWKSRLSFGTSENELLELPATEKTKGIMKTGVPGNMVQIIKVRDVVSNTEHSVYIKPSNTGNCKQLCRLSPGVILCISHLNRRCSNSGRYYFITTVLTNFTVLSYPEDNLLSEGWGRYGLRHLTFESRDKIWGVFDILNLSKVGISAKCTNCKSVFYRSCCSEACSSPDLYTMSVYAIGWLQIIHSDKTASMEKVIIKDNYVQQLLCIPRNIWQLVLEAATDEEIVFYIEDVKADELPISPDLSELFKMYCSVPKSNGKFYICVKKMSSFSDEEPFYYCIQLEPINRHRLCFVAELAKKACSR